MEAITNISKRKRRKTRRRLNELKKRSACVPVNSELHSGPKKLSINFNNYISFNRLTLFNKVIQSKTVLRGQVVNVDKNINMESKSSKTRSRNFQQKRNNNDWVSNSEIDLNIFDSDVTQQRISVMNDLKSKSCIDIHEQASSMENAMLTNSQYEVDFDLYEEFINNIPIYLKELVPQLLEDDAMKKNKLLLHQIQLEMKKLNEIIDQKSFSIPKTTHQLTHYKSDLSSNTSPLSQYSYRHSIDIEPSSSKTIFSELNSLSSDSLSSVTTKHYYLPINYMEQDSPEYTYYPHRLNQ